MLDDNILLKYNENKINKMNIKYQKAVIKRNKPVKVKKPRKSKTPIDTASTTV